MRSSPALSRHQQPPTRQWQGAPYHPRKPQAAGSYLEDHAADELMKELKSKGYDPNNGGELLKRDTDSFSINDDRYTLGANHHDDRYYLSPDYDARDEQPDAQGASNSRKRDNGAYYLRQEEDSLTQYARDRTSSRYGTKSSTMDETSYDDGTYSATSYTYGTADEDEENIYSQMTDNRTSFTMDQTEITTQTPASRKTLSTFGGSGASKWRKNKPQKKNVVQHAPSSQIQGPSSRFSPKPASCVSETSDESSFFTEITDQEFSDVMDDSFEKRSVASHATTRLQELQRKKKKIKALLQKQKQEELEMKRSLRASPKPAAPAKHESSRHFFPEEEEHDGASTSLPSINEERSNEEQSIPPPPPKPKGVASRAPTRAHSKSPRANEEPLSPTLRTASNARSSLQQSKVVVSPRKGIPPGMLTSEHPYPSKIGTASSPISQAPPESMAPHILKVTTKPNKAPSSGSWASSEQEKEEEVIDEGTLSPASRNSHRAMKSLVDDSVARSVESIASLSQTSHGGDNKKKGVTLFGQWGKKSSSPKAMKTNKKLAAATLFKRAPSAKASSSPKTPRIVATTKPVESKKKEETEEFGLVSREEATLFKRAPSTKVSSPKTPRIVAATKPAESKKKKKKKETEEFGLVSREELFKELKEEGLANGPPRRWAHADSCGSMVGKVVAPKNDTKTAVLLEPLTTDGEWSLLSHPSECLTDEHSDDGGHGKGSSPRRFAFMKRFQKAQDDLSQQSESEYSRNYSDARNDEPNRITVPSRPRDPRRPPRERQLQPGEIEVLKMGRAGNKQEDHVAPASIQASRGSSVSSVVTRNEVLSEAGSVQGVLNQSQRGLSAIRVNTLMMTDTGVEHLLLEYDDRAIASPKSKIRSPTRAISGVMKRFAHSSKREKYKPSKQRLSSGRPTVAKQLLRRGPGKVIEQIRKLSPTNKRKAKQEEQNNFRYEPDRKTFEPRARLTQSRVNSGKDAVKLFQCHEQGGSPAGATDPGEYLDLSVYEGSVASSSRASSSRPGRYETPSPDPSESQRSEKRLQGQARTSPQPSKSTQSLKEIVEENLYVPAASAPGRIERRSKRKLQLRRKKEPARASRKKPQEPIVVETVESTSGSLASSEYSKHEGNEAIDQSRSTPSSSPEPESGNVTPVSEGVPLEEMLNLRNKDSKQGGNVGDENAGANQENIPKPVSNSFMNDFFSRAFMYKDATPQDREPAQVDPRQDGLAKRETNGACSPLGFMAENGDGLHYEALSRKGVRFSEDIAQFHEFNAPSMSMTVDGSRASPMPEAAPLETCDSASSSSCSSSVELKAEPKRRGLFSFIRRNNQKRQQRKEEARRRARMEAFEEEDYNEEDEEDEEESEEESSVYSSEIGDGDSASEVSFSRDSPRPGRGSPPRPPRTPPVTPPPVVDDDEGIELIASRSKTSGKKAILIAKSDGTVQDRPASRSETPPEMKHPSTKIAGRRIESVRRANKNSPSFFGRLFKPSGDNPKTKPPGKRSKSPSEPNTAVSKERDYSPATFATDDSGYSSASALQPSTPSPDVFKPTVVARRADTVKSPASIRKAQQLATQRGTPSPESSERIMDDGDLFSVSVATDVAEPGSSVASTGPSIESSLRVDATTFEPSHAESSSSNQNGGGDFLSWLLPGVFGPIPAPTPKPLEKPSRARLHAHADELSSTDSSSQNSPLIDDEQWQDILSATETLAVQYRDAQMLDDDSAAVSISERTIEEVNTAIAKFRAHARYLGVSEKQLMEAVRDDDRSFHMSSAGKNKGNKSHKGGTKDKFIQMFEYFFLPSGPGSSLPESLNSTTAHYHGQ